MVLYHIPKQTDALRRALKGNIAYHQALLNLQNTERAIITAKNERKWTLDLTATTVVGTTMDPNLVIGPEGSGPKLLFDLEVPIDNVEGKAELVSARVAVEQAKLALEQQKKDLIGQVMAQLRTLKSDQQQITISKEAVKMLALTLRAARIKLRYGRSTVFETTQDQDLLLAQETALVGTEITYLNDFTTLYALFGETLDKWNIELSY